MRSFAGGAAPVMQREPRMANYEVVSETFMSLALLGGGMQYDNAHLIIRAK